MRVNDRVEHKDYPGTSGRVVAKTRNIILVLWDKRKTPDNAGNACDMPSRCSRHIPSALRVV